MSLCASDGQNYWNECFFNNARCSNATLRMLFFGSCASEIFIKMEIVLLFRFSIPICEVSFLVILALKSMCKKDLFLLCFLK